MSIDGLYEPIRFFMYEYKYVDFNHTMGVVQAKMDDYQGIIHEEAKRAGVWFEFLRLSIL